jgi:hypothetical protein
MAKTFPTRALGQFPQPSWFNDLHNWITFQSGLVVNVKEAPYNAVGDGVTDDTTAILAALADAKATGGGANYSTTTARKLYFPPGIYGISGPLDFATSGTWLSVVGDGPAVSTIKALSSSAHLIFANHRTRSGGFTFDGNALATFGIQFNAAASPTFFDIYVRGCAGNGIETHNLQNAILNNVNSEANGGSGLVVDDGTGSCIFTRCEWNDNNKYQLLITDTNTFSSGYTEPTQNYFQTCIAEHTNLAASGTASSGGSTTTLVSTGAGWTTNQWAGAWATKDWGGGAQQGARIISNTATTLTVESGVWGAAPDGLAYHITWPPVRVDASSFNVFDNGVITMSSFGMNPLVHIARKGLTESGAFLEFRSTRLAGSLTLTTAAIEITDNVTSVLIGTDSQIVGAIVGVRFGGGAASRLTGSLPALFSVTTPIAFVAGASMSLNTIMPRMGPPERFTAIGTGDDVIRQQVNGEANFRYTRNVSGLESWGDGTAALDTTLRRGGADWLFTDDSFTAALAIWSRAIVNKTANYTATTNDQVITANATSGVVTITLPSSTITGKVITVKKTDAVNNVVVSRAGSATIDGATTKTITTQYGFLTVIADGTNWFIVAQGGTIT